MDTQPNIDHLSKSPHRPAFGRTPSLDLFNFIFIAMASLYLKASVLWFVLAVCIGLYMGAAQDFRLVHVHVHLNLLGWASLALVGLTWASFPKLSSWRLGMIQFVMHNLGPNSPVRSRCLPLLAVQ